MKQTARARSGRENLQILAFGSSPSSLHRQSLPQSSKNLHPFIICKVIPCCPPSPTRSNLSSSTRFLPLLASRAGILSCHRRKTPQKHAVRPSRRTQVTLAVNRRRAMSFGFIFWSRPCCFLPKAESKTGEFVLGGEEEGAPVVEESGEFSSTGRCIRLCMTLQIDWEPVLTNEKIFVDLNKMDEHGTASCGLDSLGIESLASSHLDGGPGTSSEKQVARSRRIDHLDPENGGPGVSRQGPGNNSSIDKEKELDGDEQHPVNEVITLENKTESDDEDEEDADFNPFFQRSPSPEASSGLSSENEDLDEEDGVTEGEGLEMVEEGKLEGAYCEQSAFLELGSEEEEEMDENEEEEDENNGQYNDDDDRDVLDEEVVQRKGDDPSKHCGDIKSALLQGSGSVGKIANAIHIEWDNGNIDEDTWTGDECRNDRLINNETDGEKNNSHEKTEEELMGHTFAALSDLKSSPRKEQLTFERQMIQGREDEEEVVDAICKRTRAHYSLADMSLDELETFLQESDEEDYFQNVDDEEEYRKFLAAVQGKWDGDVGQIEQEGGKEEEEDEDEEDDDDFEIEIEQALESECEETCTGETRKRKRRRKGWRPEIREKRRHRIRPESKERPLGLAKTPLRPLLPSVGGMASDDSVAGRKKIMLERLSNVLSPNAKRKPVAHGFTAHQIGQLHCLIHEHVQLLVQVFSLCILEPSRQQIAIDTHGLLMELVERRDQVLSWKKTAFPDFCFRPPYLHPSVTEENEFQSMTYEFHNDFANVMPTLSHHSTCSSNTLTCDQSTVPQLSAGISSYCLSSSSSSSSSSSRLDMWPYKNSSSMAALTRDSTPAIDDSVSTQMPFSTTTQSIVVSSPAPVPCQLPQSSQVPSVCSESLTNSAEISSHSQTNVLHPAVLYPSIVSPSSGKLNSASHISTSVANVGNSVPSTSSTGATTQLKSTWAPGHSEPVRSSLDVAPLGLVREFLADIAGVVQEYRQRHVESGAYHSECEREPLFPISTSDNDLKNGKKPVQGSAPTNFGQAGLSTAQWGQFGVRNFHVSQVATGTFLSQPQIKKTMAAALVETTKRQCIALVPKGIAQAIGRFLSLFNRALFPHKPPPAATANRLLFTDAEDELLAMGLMTYNTDWKAIQHRFLPSKTMHQIFVRQKNRSSSRAPENSIKAVRRMKASPLTAEEKACIQEGLKFFKYDWGKVWQHFVPYRDPALLPRQWRIAVGTQKSYKHNEVTREKRRIYEASRRRARATKLSVDVGEDAVRASLQDGEEVEINTEDDDGEEENAVYLHEAFLSDWKPHSSHFMAAPSPLPPVADGDSNALSTNTMDKQARRPLNQNSSLQLNQEFTQKGSSSAGVEGPLATSPYTHSVIRASTSFMSDRGPRAQSEFQPHHPSKRNGSQTIKLAPGLPSLNLPPCVRVISQSKLASYQHLVPKAANPVFPQMSQQKAGSGLDSGKGRLAANLIQGKCCSIPVHSGASNCCLEHLKTGSPIFCVQCRGGKGKHGKDIMLASKNRALGNQPYAVNSESMPPYNQMVLQSNQACAIPSTAPILPLQEAEVQMHPLLMQCTFESTGCLRTPPAQMPHVKFGPHEAHVGVAEGQQLQPLPLHPTPHFHPFFGAPQGNNVVQGQQVTFRPSPVRPTRVFAVGISELHPFLQEDSGHAPGEVNSRVVWQHGGVSRPCSLCVPGSLADANVQVTQYSSDAFHAMLRPEPGSVTQQLDLSLCTGDTARHHLHSPDKLDKRVAEAQRKNTMEQNHEGGRELDFVTPEKGKAIQNKKPNVSKQKNVDTGNKVRQVMPAKTTSRQRKRESSNSSAIRDTKTHQAKSKSKVSKAIRNSQDQNGFFDLVGEDSNMNIVMEQEELSDSDEDVDEDVQFEYEEMGDSDKESSENEPQIHEHNRFVNEQEDQDIEFEEEEIVSDDSDHEKDQVDGLETYEDGGQLADECVAMAANKIYGGRTELVGCKKARRLSCEATLCSQPDVASEKKKWNAEASVRKGRKTTQRLGIGRNNESNDAHEGRDHMGETDHAMARESTEQILAVKEKASVTDSAFGSSGDSHSSGNSGTEFSAFGLQVNVSNAGKSVPMVVPEDPKIPVNLDSNQLAGDGLDVEAAKPCLKSSNHCMEGGPHISEPDKIALEAAQVLAVIHQNPAEKIPIEGD